MVLADLSKNVFCRKRRLLPALRCSARQAKGVAYSKKPGPRLSISNRQLSSAEARLRGVTKEVLLVLAPFDLPTSRWSEMSPSTRNLLLIESIKRIR